MPSMGVGQLAEEEQAHMAQLVAFSQMQIQVMKKVELQEKNAQA